MRTMFSEAAVAADIRSGSIRRKKEKMETLQAKLRDMNVKAKKLRREGMLTGSISGRDMEESVSITLQQNEVTSFMATHNVGSQVTLDVDGKKYDTIIKSVDFDGIGHHYIDMTFQQLVANEKIKARAEIIFQNEDMCKGFMTSNISEIEYKAFPADLFDKIEIDVSKYEIGANLTVGDLEVAKNPNIEITTPLDTNVLHIAEHQKMQDLGAETAEGETEEASTEA